MNKSSCKKLSLIAVTLIIAVALLFSIFWGMSAFAAQQPQVLSQAQMDSLFAGGTGTASDPYLIENSAQLKAIASTKQFNSYNQTYSIEKHFKLLQDILIDGTWTPIPYSFNGSLDGNNKGIGEIRFAAPEQGEMYGMFSLVKGTIKNLNIETVEITTGFTATSSTQTYIGVLAGQNMGTIVGCQVKYGTVTSDTDNTVLGGIAGVNNGEIRECLNCADITGNGIIGGIAGVNALNGDIYTCYNRGDITLLYGSTAGCAGGIIGKSNAANAYVSKGANYGGIIYGSAYKLKPGFKPCMAQICGWLESGSAVSGPDVCFGSCDFSNLGAVQKQYCKNEAIGREGA